MELSAWQRRALNVFGLAPVYGSTDTTPDRLVLHAARGFMLGPGHAKRLAALGPFRFATAKELAVGWRPRIQ